MILLTRRRRVEERAGIVIVSYISCPYCGSIYRVLTLGAIAPRVETRMSISKLGVEHPNPQFRETHLANPITCPACGRTYTVFVGIERNAHGLPRRVHVVVARNDEPFVSSLSKWPHQGIVEAKVIEHTGDKLYIYQSMDHYLSYRGEEVDAAAIPVPTGQEDLVEPEEPPRQAPLKPEEGIAAGNGLGKEKPLEIPNTG